MDLKCIDGPLKGETFACRYNSIYEVSGTIEDSINRAHERGRGFARREIYLNDNSRACYNWFVDNGTIVLKFDR